MRKGTKHSEESRMKISIAMEGKKYGPRSQETKDKMSKAHIGERNGKWRGDNVENHGLHRYVERYLPKPEKCQICNEAPPYDLANKTGIYNRDLENWYWLCRRCHVLSDGRIKNLIQYSGKIR